MKTTAEHLIPYRAYLFSERQRLTDLIQQMENQNRQDEANLLKIRLNILGVFETVAGADEQQTSAWEDFCLRYEPRFQTLTALWRAHLTAAQQHSDLSTQLIEEEKLSAANEIKNVFLSIKE